MNYKQIMISISIMPLIFSCGSNKTSTSNIEQNNMIKGEIASIKAASGISYCNKNNTLMIASDNGKIYEMTQSGKILSVYTVGNYDFEGIVCEDKELIIAIEGTGLLRFNRTTKEIEIFPLEGATHIKMSKQNGIEGLVKVDEAYYLAIQSQTKKNAKLLKVLLDKTSATVISTITTKIIDMSGLEYRNEKLYIVSDTNDKLYLYDIKKEKILQSIPLPKFAQEGITFAKDNGVFFANDNGSVFRYELLKDKNESWVLVVK